MTMKTGQPSKPAARARQDDDASPKKMNKARRPSSDEDEEDADDEEPQPKAKKKGKKKAKQGSSGHADRPARGWAVVLVGGGIGVYFGLIREDKPTESSRWPRAMARRGRQALRKDPRLPGDPGRGSSTWTRKESTASASPAGRRRKTGRRDGPGHATTATKVARAAGRARDLFGERGGRPAGTGPGSRCTAKRGRAARGNPVGGATITSKQPITHAGVNGRESACIGSDARRGSPGSSACSLTTVEFTLSPSLD